VAESLAITFCISEIVVNSCSVDDDVGQTNQVKGEAPSESANIFDPKISIKFNLSIRATIRRSNGPFQTYI
jgi:hypothetical protein